MSYLSLPSTLTLSLHTPSITTPAPSTLSPTPSTISLLEIPPRHPTPPPPTPPPPTFSLVISANVPPTWMPSPHTQEQILSHLSTITREAGWDLAAGTTALDTVVRIITLLEDSGTFNCGRGATGGCGAAIVGTGRRYGGVVGLQETRNPIIAARAVLEEQQYGLKVGRSGDAFAKEKGCESVDSEYFSAAWKGNGQERVDGVGVVVMDKYGELAAGVSMGWTDDGNEKEIFSRIIVDSGCAVFCSGSSQELTKRGTAGKVCSLLKYVSLSDAATQALLPMVGADCPPASIAAIDSTGHITLQSSQRAILTATVSSSSPPSIKIFPNSLLVTPKHTLTLDEHLSIALTRYPLCRGHTVATLTNAPTLTSLPPRIFLSVLTTLRTTALKLTHALPTPHIAFASTGAHLSLIPLPGVSPIWTPTPTHPTSQKGTPLSTLALKLTHLHITSLSLPQPVNTTYSGPRAHRFAGILRCETDQYRIWEDAQHVAFLDADGAVLVVPRRCARSVFGLCYGEYQALVAATYAVCRVLIKALGLSGCSVYFLGWEEEYAHVRLVPVPEEEEGLVVTGVGPLAGDLEELERMRGRLAREMRGERVVGRVKGWRRWGWSGRR